jgi:hypothetical protein
MNVYCKDCRFRGAVSVCLGTSEFVCANKKNMVDTPMEKKWGNPIICNAYNDCKSYLPKRTNKKGQYIRVLGRRLWDCIKGESNG